MDIKEKYNLWLTFDEDTRAELEDIGFIRIWHLEQAVFAELWAPAQTE